MDNETMSLLMEHGKEENELNSTEDEIDIIVSNKTSWHKGDRIKLIHH